MTQPKKKVLICGVTGFIGRNLLNHFLEQSTYELFGTYYQTKPEQNLLHNPKVKLFKTDLTDRSSVENVVRGMDIVIQAAATTSGAKDIVTKPYYHVTDNAVMNSLIFRACHDHQVKHVVFFSCTVMYSEQNQPVKESDFKYEIIDQYFGAGWTKVYLEKMCEFYSRFGTTRYTAIRHSNIYGPFDKYDLERSHVFGATVAKVMHAKDGKIVVWGDGSEERDLLYVDDLVAFVERVLDRQRSPFELINVGYGKSISVRELVDKIIQHSGQKVKIEFDRSKPSINFKLSINIDQAKELYSWKPQISLDQGIQKSLAWYRSHDSGKS